MLRKLLCLFLICFALQPALSFNNWPLAASAERRQLSSHTAATAHQHADAVSQRKTRGRALWPNSSFTEVDRKRAILRGLQFIYRTALQQKNFEDYGQDYLWCFYTLSAAVLDVDARRMARRMGMERARFWRRTHRFVSSDADAVTISTLAYGNDAADSLGVYDHELTRQLKRAAPRFKARDYLLFDPLTESPPVDVPDDCKRCGASNVRGAKVCFVCKTPLIMRTRYDVWYDALITAYVAERSGINFGARYLDVLKWLPTLRPYRASPGDVGEEFHDTVYAITHIVYTLNNYSQYKLSPRLLPQEFEFLKTNLKAAIDDNDDDMLGEFMDSLRAFGLTTNDPSIRAGMEYYLSHQNRDGSWGDEKEKDIYLRYHPTWNAIAGLSEYTWKSEGLSFPEVKPWLEKWAQPESNNSSGLRLSPDTSLSRHRRLLSNLIFNLEAN
jgi:hypothetical protein